MREKKWMNPLTRGQTGGLVETEPDTGKRTNRGNTTIIFAMYGASAIRMRIVLSVLSLLLLCGQSLSCPCRSRSESDGMHVNCSHNDNLKTVPDDLPDNTTWLDLSYTNLTEIKNDTFVNVPLLIYLDLYHAKLKKLEPRAFAGLSNLRYLNISDNDQLPQTNIRTPLLLFQELRSLTELKMFGTTTLGAPGTYPDKALSYLTSLTHLIMDGIQGQYLGEGFSNLTNLTFLSISGDNVRLGARFCHMELDNITFKYVPHITHLEMRSCDITRIGDATFDKLLNLTYLDLSFNKNLSIDPVTKAMDSLAKTAITVLKINHIYDTGAMTSGVVITKGHCQQIQKLKNLNELHIASNAIVSIQKNALKYLPGSLEKIYASANEFEIHYFVFQLQYLKNLKYIDVSFQFFSELLWIKGPGDAENTVSTTRNEEIHNFPWSYSKGTSVSIREYSECHSVEENAKEYVLDDGSSDMTEADEPCVNTPLTTHCPNVPDGHIPVGLIQPYLPPKLETLDMSHCKLAVPLFNMSFAGKNALTEIKAQNSLLYCWDGPISGIEGLKKLNLSYNLCTSVSNHFFDSHPKLENLDVSHNMIGPDIMNDNRGCIFKKLINLQSINLTDNQLTFIPRNLFTAQRKLEYIILGHNLLKTFELSIKHMERLRKIDLTFNFISTLSERMRTALEDAAERSSRVLNDSLIVDLSINEIYCNCPNLDFLEWISQHQSGILNISMTGCMAENQTVIKLKDSRALAEVIFELRKNCTSYTTLIVILIVCLAVFFNIIVAALVYRYRWKLRYRYYRRGRSRFRRGHGYALEHIFSHDAFVVSSDDFKKVIEEKLIPNLEIKRNMPLLIEFRDHRFFCPGGNVYQQITHAVGSSRCTIFLVTRDNTKDETVWTCAFRMAEEESNLRGYTMYFAIILEDVSHIHLTPYIDRKLKEIFKSGMFVDFPLDGTPDAEEEFYDECMARIRNAETARSRRMIDVTLSI